MKITKSIYNSNGKVIGEIIQNNQEIIVNNYKKPILYIKDKKVLGLFNQREISDEDIVYLWDEYELTIGEIAAIVGVVYSNINKRINLLAR